jgi:hypothetical protein
LQFLHLSGCILSKHIKKLLFGVCIKSFIINVLHELLLITISIVLQAVKHFI